MKRCVILQIAYAVIILSKVTFAKYYEKDLLNLLKDAQGMEKVGRPGTPRSEESKGKCKKDILFIVDASLSVGQENMNLAKKFLKDLVRDPDLNVSPEGTNVAFMVFSSKEDYYTKILQNFNHDYDKSSLDSIINRYQWNKRGYTRTDLALKMAREQIFKKPSPKNHREDIDDVIVLITDGAPHDRRMDETLVIKDTKDEAEKLIKNKKVTIIGVGIGDKISWNTLQDISGPVQPLVTDSFNILPSIKKQLVAKSCERISPGVQCTCPDVTSTVYLKPGETSKKIHWKRPDPKCGADVSVVRSTSAYNSPTSFTHGEHEIKYKFFLSENREIDCVVKIIVRACECPQKELGVVPVKPGDTKIDLEWQVPVPSCLKCPSPMTSQSLSVGQHSMAYKYNIGNQFNMTCQLNLKVTGALCNENGYNQDSQECCCGVIHDKKTGYECCGQNHFNIKTHQCCDGNIRKKDEECLKF